VIRRIVVALSVAAAAALLGAGPAGAARFAVGVDPSVPLSVVTTQLRELGPVTRSLARLHVLIVESPSVRGVKRIRGVRWVEWLGSRRRRVAFTPTDPLAAKQWYLQLDRAFDFWSEPPNNLAPVKVAVVDSGIDVTHPDLASRILLARSFVGGSVADVHGHGTFVAGEIAAATNNAEGIAGIAFPAQLLVAKVVRADGTISLEAEATAIRWAVDEGARVINLSLGGLRDPGNLSRDTYSALEAAAVDYAAAKGVLLVAAVGNSDQAPVSPWPFASYPAALPHVVGVSSLARDGSVSVFSDRDAVYNDIAAPGEDILSTLPRALTRDNTACVDQGYSDCGPDEYRHPQGTSFAAPQVAAAAALLLAESPSLTASQAATLLERTAVDLNASSGCAGCPLLRDSLSGWGRLDATAALTALTNGPLPPADRYETNDDIGGHKTRLAGTRGKLSATVDYWDDQTDIYAADLVAGRRLTVSLAGAAGTTEQLRLWSPQTRTIFGVSSRKLSVARSTRAGARQRLSYVVPAAKGGRYYLQVKIARPGADSYTLSWTKPTR
jgi:subtilisin family serine protease